MAELGIVYQDVTMKYLSQVHVLYVPVSSLSLGSPLENVNGDLIQGLYSRGVHCANFDSVSVPKARQLSV